MIKKLFNEPASVRAPRLQSRVVVVTGAGRGIGRAIAIACATEGAQVALISRNRHQLDETAEAIRAVGGEEFVACADVSSRSDVNRVSKEVLSRFGRVDVLVNNAAQQKPIGPFVTSDPQEWIDTIQVNLIGTMLCCRALLAQMIDRRSGKIINFSGGGAATPRIRFSAYAASKAAVVRFTETIAQEVKEFGIDVNAVAPGAVGTSMVQEILAAGDYAGADEMRRAKDHTANSSASLLQIAKLVLFLASSESDRLTGKLISAVHDPWQEWRGRGEDISGSMMFTLRRLDCFTLNELQTKYVIR